MDARSIELLEFPLIRSRLAAYAAFEPSRRLALALEPVADPFVVTRRLDETDEARWLLSMRPDIGIGGARDIAPFVGRAARGGRLDPTELWAVVETLIAAGRLADHLRELERPLLHALYRDLEPMPALRTRLEASVDPAGEVLDSASPALGGLRRAVRIAHERLRSRLETLIHSDLAASLQEPLVTLRGGRYVVPVRAEARGRVKGIVHDQSGSGQTLFVEPLVAVELANAWREAQLAAQAEEERVLDELSGQVAAAAEALGRDLDALARFDLWMCRARLAEEMDAVRPAAATRTVITLLSARHPGLAGAVVPIDVHLGGDVNALVITGPNTGGKTVALRTVGLLVLMNQAGLHVPASTGSALPVFREVLADIGDEQSVAQSLSTFSGHLRTITRIVEIAGEDSLVLLDELGAGTDPTEGSALAQALLDHFIRAGALVVATTHYAELKTYAHNEPRARNASVDFDLATLAPTYHLSIGLPGTSQAFAIAERLGLPSPLVEDARSRLSVAEREFESTLASIRDSQRAITAAEGRAAEAETRMRAALAEAEEERRRARAERRVAAAEARRQAEVALAAVEAEDLRDTRLTGAGDPHRGPARPGHGAHRCTARDAAVRGRPRIDRGDPGAPLEGRDRALAGSGWNGTIAALDEARGRATLEVGGLRVDVPLDELEPASGTGPALPSVGALETPGRPLAPKTGRRGDFGAAPRTRAAAGGSGVSTGTTVQGRPTPADVGRSDAGGHRKRVASSLDLRGARVEEALELLDRYVDDAARADAGRVTIIHGHGSGAMRDAVRQALGSHPLVREWRPGERGEGGDGATIVSL